MQEEIKALHANDTWDLVELLKGRKHTKSKLLMANPSIRQARLLRDMPKKRALISKMTTLCVFFALTITLD